MQRGQPPKYEESRTASCDVVPSYCLITLEADQIKPPEIVSFAKWVLFAVRSFNREELRRCDDITILGGDEVCMRYSNN